MIWTKILTRLIMKNVLLCSWWWLWTISNQSSLFTRYGFTKQNCTKLGLTWKCLSFILEPSTRSIHGFITTSWLTICSVKLFSYLKFVGLCSFSSFFTTIVIKLEICCLIKKKLFLFWKCFLLLVWLISLF